MKTIGKKLALALLALGALGHSFEATAMSKFLTTKRGIIGIGVAVIAADSALQTVKDNLDEQSIFKKPPQKVEETCEKRLHSISHFDNLGA